MTTVPTGRARTVHPGTLTPLAALMTRIARLINDEQLPDDGTVSVSTTCVSVDATGRPLPENIVRRWAQALELVVHVQPFDWQGGAAVLYTASDVRDGIYYVVQAIVPIEPRFDESRQDDTGRLDEVRNDVPVQVVAVAGRVL